MTRRRVLLLAFTIIGMIIPALFLWYPYDETYWTEWVLEPFTYPSAVFVFLLYAVSCGVFTLLWLRGTGSRSASVGTAIIVLVLLFSLPLVVLLWLFTFGDYHPSSPYEQVPRQIAVLNPMLSALIGSWIGWLVSAQAVE